MAIKSPYTRQISSYSPQRSAGIGRTAALPQEYALGFRGIIPQAPIQPVVQKQPTTVDEMLTASGPPVDLEGGPGVGAFGGEGTPGPSAVDTGLVSPETGRSAEQLASMAIFGNTKGIPSLSTLTGLPSTLALSVPNLAMKGGKMANEALGDPIGKAKDAFLGFLGLGSQSTGMQGGIPAAQAASHAHALNEAEDANLGLPAPSSLADIGIGVGGSTGVSEGGFTGGDFGGGWGLH